MVDRPAEKPTTDKTAEAPPDTCPECGIDFAGRDRVKHGISHYGDRPIDAKLYPDAAKRQAQLSGKG